MNFRSSGSTVFVNRRPIIRVFARSLFSGILWDVGVLRRRLNFDNWCLRTHLYAPRRRSGGAAVARRRKKKMQRERTCEGEEKEAERRFPEATRGPGQNRSLLSYRTPILIRTRSMQVGWMPASSPGGTTGRYDACNLFLLPPIFFLPLDQLLLIPRSRASRERGIQATSPGLCPRLKYFAAQKFSNAHFWYVNGCF